MNIDLSTGDLALLSALITGPAAQAEWCSQVIHKALRKETSQTEITKEFDEQFWPLVLKKQDKGHARRAFIRVRASVSLDTILAGLARYNASVRDRDPKFICMPATWLNGERWADESPRAPDHTNGKSDPDYVPRSKIVSFLRTGRWVFPEPKPTDSSCVIPKHILREFLPQFQAKGLRIPVLESIMERNSPASVGTVRRAGLVPGAC